MKIDYKEWFRNISIVFQIVDREFLYIWKNIIVRTTNLKSNFVYVAQNWDHKELWTFFLWIYHLYERTYESIEYDVIETLLREKQDTLSYQIWNIEKKIWKALISLWHDNLASKKFFLHHTNQLQWKKIL
jgi:hypothetical protein